MASMSFTDAFKKYGATLTNPQWAVSSRTDNDEIVVSLWTHHITLYQGKLRCTDKLSRWGGNKLGNSLLREHLTAAQDENLPIRLVLARTEDANSVDNGHDASSLKKTFSVRTDLVGQIVSFDGDKFVIDFSKV